MLITASLFWWLAALLVAMLEVLSGTFYLLAVALGLATVALAVSLGQALTVALIGGSVVMALAVFSVARWRRQRASAATAMPDDDLGGEVQLVRLAADSPHHGRVRHRGCEWDAELDYAGPPPVPGTHGRITGRHANLLRVHFVPPSAHTKE